MVNFTLRSTTNEMISIFTLQTSRSWVLLFNRRRPIACLSLNFHDTPGLARRMNVLFWGPGDFQVSYSNRDTFWDAWNRHSGSFTVDTGMLFSIIWSNPLTNVKWHSDPWPTVTSQPIRLSTNFMTFIPSLTLTELWVVSMEHLQRVWLASRERLPFRTPGSVPLFGTCLCSNCWDQISRTCHVYSTFRLEYPLVLSRFCFIFILSVTLCYQP